PLIASVDQGIRPVMSIRVSDGRIFIVGRAIAKRIENLLKKGDKLQSEVDEGLEHFPEIQKLRKDIADLDAEIADVLLRCQSADGEDLKTSDEAIETLQGKRQKVQQSIAALKKK
ncbi:hypothetical protein HDU96_002184, partial [Phlyctochytrium bullatum]